MEDILLLIVIAYSVSFTLEKIKSRMIYLETGRVCARRARSKQVMAEEMAAKIEDVKVEIDQLSEKIGRRIEKLEKQTGGEPVMMYRHDPIIREALIKIRGLYHKGEEICVRYHLGEKTCKLLETSPQSQDNWNYLKNYVH